MSSAFDFLAFSEEEGLAALEDLRKEDEKQSLICICGHSIGRHTDVYGTFTCSANKQSCPCREKRAVLSVENARPFLRKTRGSGALHALGQGITTAISAEQKLEWIVDPICDRCGLEGKLTPVATTERGGLVETPSRYNQLVCIECMKVI